MNEPESFNPHTFDRNGHVSHWWAALCAVPATKDSAAYRRLERVWFDHTRFRGPSPVSGPTATNTGSSALRTRYHGFVKPNEEINLTVTLWENFSIFDCKQWLPMLLRSVGLAPNSPIAGCNWSYEWVTELPERRMCDLVLEFESLAVRYIIVIEAKRLDARMTTHDLDQTYYLDTIPEIAAFGDRRRLIYLIDQTRAADLAAALQPRQSHIGILTWQRLAGLQIELAKTIEGSDEIKNFVAGAIQYQFAQHNIRPDTLSTDYLKTEPSISEVDAMPPAAKQSMNDHRLPLWKL